MRSSLHLVTVHRLARVVFLVTICMLMTMGPAVSAQSQGTLTGEMLEGTVTSARFNDSNCSILAVESLATIATGPYPGTATVRFEARFTDPDPITGVMAFLNFQESFTIVSGDTVVTGTKTLPADFPQVVTPGSSGVCTRTDGDEFFDVITFHTSELLYTAQIQHPDGSVTTDSGTATVTGGYSKDGPVPFIQTFASTTPVCSDDEDDSDDSEDDGDDECDDSEDDDGDGDD